MATVVEYILSLKDSLSKGIDHAHERVKELESTLGSVNKVLGVLGVSMGAYAGYEALKGAHEVWEKIEQSTAKVSANLKSNGGAAGMGMDEIENMATSLSSHIKANKAEVMDMQSQLLTFPTITKEVFENSMGMVADIAAQTNHGLSETAIMFGKAFADPEKGLNKLVRYGVLLSDQEKDRIVKLEESGHLIDAQKSMLEAISNAGYAGVATAMFNADASGQYEKSLYNIQLAVGELITSLQRELMPVALEFLKWIKSSVDWIKQHTSLLWSMTKGILAMVVAFKTASMIIIPFVSSLTAVAPAAASAAVGLEAAGVATTAALGPIGLLAAAIGGLVMLYGNLDAATKRMEDNRTKLLNEAEDKELARANHILDIYTEQGMKKNDAIKQIYDERDAFINARRRKLDDERKGQTPFGVSAEDFKKDLDFKSALLDKQEGALSRIGLVPKKGAIKNNEGASPKDNTASKATGSKSVTINVSIKDLIGTQNINTTNLKEGAGKIKDMVVAALTGAVNDFQIVAGK